MVDLRTESLCPSADGMTMAELRQAAARGDILQSTALACDNARQLRFQLAGWPAVMPYEECADGAAEGSVRDIAILTRVGRPTCFVIRGIHEEPGQPPVFELSRTAAQQACRAQYLDRLLPHDPHKIRPLLERDVADPWYTGDFSQTWLDVVEGCEKILEELGC